MMRVGFWALSVFGIAEAIIYYNEQGFERNVMEMKVLIGFGVVFLGIWLWAIGKRRGKGGLY